MNPYSIVILACLLLAGCVAPKQRAKYAKMNEWDRPVYLITPEEIEGLPEILSTSEMITHFGPPPRCEIDVGIYPRYNPKVDYSKPLGDAFTEGAYLFFPHPRDKTMVDVIVTAGKSELVVVWPKKNAGMSLDAYYKEKHTEPNKALEPTTMAVTPPAAQASRQP